MVDVGDLAAKAATGLIPPGFNPSKMLRWQLWVSGILLVGNAMNILHIAIACGYLSSFGLSGFALATDFNTSQGTLTAINLAAINRDLRDAKTNICLAQKPPGNQAALTSWSMQLEQAKGRYFAVTHNWPSVESCEELLVTARSPSG